MNRYNEKKHLMNHIGDADFKEIDKLASLYEASNLKWPKHTSQ